MKKTLLVLLALPLLFSNCKKEDSSKQTSPTIYNEWQLTIQTTSLSHGDIYTAGQFIDSLTGTLYNGQLNSLGSGAILVSNDTVFPGLSTSYSSRTWIIDQNQIIIDTYYNGNGFPYNILQHNFAIYYDTLVVNFQSGGITKFIINELTSDHLHITSLADTSYSPLFDSNGIYQDTLFMNLNSDKYFFDKIQ